MNRCQPVALGIAIGDIGYAASAPGAIIGAVWGLIDGFIAGVIIGWPYNRVAKS